MEVENYWKSRCDLAEKYIKESPFNPDIYPDQLRAYNQWMRFKKIAKKKP
jgi:hypothetical protein